MEKVMRRIILATVAAISLTGVGALYTNSAQAAPLFDGLQGAVPASNITNVQLLFLFGGHRYCWYWDGWNGPGWYWCGYASRRGLGYGGREGWHGHGAPPRGGHQASAPMGGRALMGSGPKGAPKGSPTGGPKGSPKGPN
jgi:hypothetical protein